MTATDHYRERASYHKHVEEFCELVESYCTFLEKEPCNHWYIPKVNPHHGIIDYISLSDIRIYTNVKFGKNCILVPVDDKGNIALNWEHSVHVDYRNKDKIKMCLKQLQLSYRKALEDYKIEKIEKDFV